MTGEQHSDSAALDLPAFAVALISRALTNIPLTASDRATLDVLQNAPSSEDKPFFEMVSSAGHAITPGLWAFYLQLLLHNWNDQAKDTAVLLPTVRELYPSAGDSAANALLDATIQTLELLAWLGYEEGSSNSDRASPEELVKVMHHLAEATEASGNAGDAYDVAALALDMVAPIVRGREELARYALGLALKADKAHQVAACSQAVAASIGAAADALPARRAEAFDAFEIAIDRLRSTPQPFQSLLAQGLASEVSRREYLRTLMIPLWFFFPESDRPKGFKAAVGGEYWPERFSEVPREKWLQELKVMWTAQIWDMEIEKARLALEPLPRQEAAHADWTTLTVDHPAYRRAVPNGRSFLREAEFDKLLLVLSHEITHILSMLGGVGVMLTSLRVGLMNAETVLWSLQARAGSDMEQFKGRVALEGVAPLERGDPGLLFRTEQALELTLKARILQDVWSPWFEGLAIFGESAADPALDVVTIGAVSDCLRNMVDFEPTRGAPEARTEDSIRKEYEAFVQEFESRCSGAITRHGPVRLNQYLRSPNPSYFAGYLAIRRVVSTWRERTGRTITGPEAFSLLLHATRDGTFEAIPNLSLHSELFSHAASKMMLDWASQLAKLHPNDINDYLSHPDRTAQARTYVWEEGRLKRVAAQSEDALETRERATVAKRLRQAVSSLTLENDEDRVKTADPMERWLIEAMSKKGREVVEHDASQWDRLVFSLNTLATLLPIGQTASNFFANGDPSTEWPILALSIRTTEHNASDGGPSVNGYWFPVDSAAAERIKKEYRSTGRPRVEVTRVIDLWGLGSATRRVPGVHFLAFKSGEWFEIRGATSLVNDLVNRDAERKVQVTDLVRRRLYPDPLLLAFQGILARGDDGARRTARWIDESDAWTVDGQTVPVENWVLHTRKLAGRIVALEAERVARQKAVAKALVSALFGDDELSEMVTAGGFELMTEQFPTKRGQIVDALFNTAKVPVANDQAVYALGFGTDRTPLFTKGLHGWDVAPSH